MEPKRTRPILFNHLDELNEEERLSTQHHDDLKQDYTQLFGERGNIFTWECLEAGPEWWKVRIRKCSKSEK